MFASLSLSPIPSALLGFAVQLIGVSVHPADQPVLIVLEYMHLGSLQSYLQRCVLGECAL